jgi:hypothetical protein
LSPESFEVVVTNVRVDEPKAEALLYLANYYQDNLEYNQALLCGTRLEDHPGPKKRTGQGSFEGCTFPDGPKGRRREGSGGRWGKVNCKITFTNDTNNAIAK